MSRFLALGDSYTIGEAVSPEDTWPNVLSAALGIPKPQIIAKTAWTTDELDAAIDSADVQPPFALVTLLIGVNDQYRGRAVEEYRSRFAPLLQRAVTFAGRDPRRVIVVSIPDWGVTPFAEGRDRARIAAEIDAFNAVNRDEAEKIGARYVDVTQASRETGAYAADGLHPAAPMYRRWVDLMISEARAALGVPR